MTSLRRLADPLTALLAATAASAALLAGAWVFELVLKLQPCKLCLEQRQPHYAAAAIGLAVLAVALWRRDLAARLVRPALVIVLALSLGSIGLGTYHSGVEWGWFPAPSDCGGAPPPAPKGMQDFLSQLESVKVVSCAAAAWRFLGLSLAGWNVVASVGLAVLAIAGLSHRRA